MNRSATSTLVPVCVGFVPVTFREVLFLNVIVWHRCRHRWRVTHTPAVRRPCLCVVDPVVDPAMHPFSRSLQTARFFYVFGGVLLWRTQVCSSSYIRWRSEVIYTHPTIHPSIHPALCNLLHLGHMVCTAVDHLWITKII